jgi:hypothetical protein
MKLIEVITISQLNDPSISPCYQFLMYFIKTHATDPSCSCDRPSCWQVWPTFLQNFLFGHQDGLHDSPPPPPRRLPVKRYLINYPHLSDYGQTIFCLSFPPRDRATAPGRYEQFYFTKHVPYPQKIHSGDAIRSDDLVQLFCNSFCVQHKMVGDDYPFILQCLCTAKRVQFITGGYSPVPKVDLFLCLSNLLRSAPWAYTNIFRVHKVALLLCLSNLLRSAPWTSTIIFRIIWASPSQV